MADIKKIIEIEFKTPGGDKVLTTNKKVIQQIIDSGAAYNVTKTAIEENTAAIEENVAANNEQTQSLQDNTAAAEGNAKAQTSIKKELATLKAEIAASIAAGDTQSETYKKNIARAGELADAMEDANKVIGANKSAFDSSIGAAKGLASGYAAAEGALGLFGGASQDALAGLQKVQSALALLQGLEGLEDAGKSFKAFGSTIKDVGKNAFGSLRQGIISTGIGALVIGIGLLIANFDAVKEAVLKFIPGLKAVGDFIGKLVTGITDFIGVTSEAERKAEGLGKQSKKNQEIAKNDIELLKAKGASADVIYKAEKKAAQDRLKDLNKIGGLNKKLTDEELKEKKELIQQIKVLDAQETKRKADELDKQMQKAKADADKAAEQAAEKAKAAAEKRKEARLAALKAEQDLIAKLDLDARKAGKSSFDQQRIDLEIAQAEELKVLDAALAKKAITKKKYDEDVAKLNAANAAKSAEITKAEQEAEAKRVQDYNNMLINMAADAENATTEQKIKAAQNRIKLAQDEALKLAKTEEDKNKIILAYGVAQADAEKAIKKKAEEDKIKIALEATDDQLKIDTELNGELAKIYNDDTLSFEEKEKAILQKQKEYNKKQLDEQKAQIEKAIELEKANPYRDPKKLEDLGNKLSKVNADIAKNNSDAQEEASKKFMESAEKIFDEVSKYQNALNELGSALSDFYGAQIAEIENLAAKQTESLNKQKDEEISNKELTAEERQAIEQRYALEQAKLDEETALKKKELQKKQADIEFAITIGQIIANTAMAIIKAYGTMDPISATIFSAIIGATGALQAATAKKQRDQVMALASGGLVSGPGGPTDDMIPAMLSNGEAVINAAAVKRYAPLLSQINQSTGGAPIPVPKFAAGGLATSDQILLGISDRINSIAATQQQDAPVRAYVLDTEVSSTSAKNNRIRRASTY